MDKEPKGWHSRGYLPHFDAPGLTQSINFRVYGSLPKEVIERFQNEVGHLNDVNVKREMATRIDKYLDVESDTKLLANPAHADTVQRTLLNADGELYHLHAWCVMPTHVHVLCTPTGKVSLGEIVKGWKGTTNRLIRQLEPGLSRVWAEDYFDRYIRNEIHYWNEVAYIERNPVTANLCTMPEDYPWSSARAIVN